MKTLAIAFLAAFVATSAHAKPDLIARDLTIDGGLTYLEVDPGEDVKLRWTAQNIGSLVSGSNQGVMWSTNSIISRADRLLEKEYVGFLLKNASSPEIRTITIPNDVTPGNSYYVGIYADYDQEEDEGSESNNASNFVIFRIKGGTPPVPKPDFVASDAMLNGSRYLRQVTPGETLTVRWKATNLGVETSLSQQQAVFMSTNEIISDADTLLGESELAGTTGKDETRAQTLAVTIPDDAVVGAIYYIGIYMDYTRAIQEESEINNASDVIQVVIVGDSSPEITVKSGGEELASRSKLDFGTVAVGETGDTRIIKITNTGTDDLKVRKYVIKGRSKSEFNVRGAKRKKLAPGRTMRIKVTLTPKSKGRKKATIRIQSNDPDEAKFNVRLRGRGE